MSLIDPGRKPLAAEDLVLMAVILAALNWFRFIVQLKPTDFAVSRSNFSLHRQPDIRRKWRLTDAYEAAGISEAVE